MQPSTINQSQLSRNNPYRSTKINLPITRRQRPNPSHNINSSLPHGEPTTSSQNPILPRTPRLTPRNTNLNLPSPLIHSNIHHYHTHQRNATLRHQLHTRFLSIPSQTELRLSLRSLRPTNPTSTSNTTITTHTSQTINLKISTRHGPYRSPPTSRTPTHQSHPKLTKPNQKHTTSRHSVQHTLPLYSTLTKPFKSPTPTYDNDNTDNLHTSNHITLTENQTLHSSPSKRMSTKSLLPNLQAL